MAGLKRYLLFGGNTYYPAGGWEDFVSSYDEVSLAVDAGMSQFGEHLEWWHIFDTQGGEICAEAISGELLD